jgi:nucleoside-diphosphate-sugar epimerase
MILFREFAKAGGHRIVAMGSCAEYNWKQGSGREGATSLQPASLYGRSKQSLRRMLDDLASSGAVNAAWARLFFPYGPGEHPSKLVSSLSTALLKGEAAECATPDLRRDFIYAADVGSALASVLASDLTGAIDIGSGVAVRIREVAESVARAIGRTDLLRFRTPVPGADEDPPVIADVTRLKDQLHWTPRYSLETGVDKTVAWVRHALQSPAAHAASRTA